MTALLTNKGNSSTPTWTVSGANYTANEDVVDILSCTKYTTDGSGGLTVNGASGNPQVLLPTSALPKNGSLCPNLATGAQTSPPPSSSSAAKLLLPVGTALGAALVVAQFFLF